MQYWEILIVCVALSVDVFAVAVCQGSMLERVRGKDLLFLCLLFSVMQLAALELGRLLARFTRFANACARMIRIWYVLAAAIFFLLAAYLLYKALLRKPFFEHRSAVNYRHIWFYAAFVCIDAFLVGIGSGFLQAALLASHLTLFCVTSLFVVLGVYTGYHFGYEQKNTAYWCGAVLFLTAAVDVIVRYLF